MRIAIVCDWLVTVGGAENFLGELLQCFPEADLFSVVDFLDHQQRDFLQQKTVTTTFIQHLPFAKKKYRSYLPLMPLAIEQLDLSAYSLIISSSHAVAKGVITGPDQMHISYIHSPMRYAWDLQHQYLKETGLNKKWYGWLARYFLHRLRMWDFRSAQSVDYFIANSNYIARRISKTYRRKATVIYSPIALDHFIPCSPSEKKDFYLTASRLVPYKRIDLIVEAFSQLPNKELIVIGEGPEMSKIKNKAGKNVKILGYQSNEILRDYLKKAKAFIFAAEEDFGLLPLEAQASGTPVIAYGKGGALETVKGLDDTKPTGLFFQEQNIASLCKGIELFERNQSTFTQENCLLNASRFSPAQFRTQMIEFVETRMLFSRPY